MISRFFLFLIIATVLFSTVLAGAPSFGGVITAHQPDGTRIEFIQYGDECLNFILDLYGRPLKQDPLSRFWHYGVVVDGEIQRSDLLKGIDQPTDIPSFEPRQLLKSLKISMQSSVEFQDAVVFSEGTIKIPVILVDYPDYPHTYNVKDFEEIIFSAYPELAPFGSVRDYYSEVSNGSVDLSGEVYGWYTADKSKAHYPQNEFELVREAISKADKDIDFSLYDNNDDGVVDMIIVIHEGMGRELSGDQLDIWSFQSRLFDYETDDGVTADLFTIQPERVDWPRENGGDPVKGIATIGVMAHETGHLFGLPDLYDYSGATWGIGSWGMMAYGCWNYVDRPGDMPAHFSAWSKLKLGWFEPLEISRLSGDLFLEDVKVGGKLLKFSNISRPEEYFLIENRTKFGFDYALPGEGLLIYHIDDAVYGNSGERKQVYLLQADGRDDLMDTSSRENRGDDGDPYPGSSDNVSFSPESTPSSNWYDESSSGLEFSSISHHENEIYLDLGSRKTEFALLDTVPSGNGNGIMALKLIETETPIASIQLLLELDSAQIDEIIVSERFDETRREVTSSADGVQIKLSLLSVESNDFFPGAVVTILSSENSKTSILESALLTVEYSDRSLMKSFIYSKTNPADINGDGLFDESDNHIFFEKYFTKYGDETWDMLSTLCDFDNDDSVGSSLIDIALFGIYSVR